MPANGKPCVASTDLACPARAEHVECRSAGRQLRWHRPDGAWSAAGARTGSQGRATAGSACRIAVPANPRDRRADPGAMAFDTLRDLADPGTHLPKSGKMPRHDRGGSKALGRHLLASVRSRLCRCAGCRVVSSVRYKAERLSPSTCCARRGIRRRGRTRPVHPRLPSGTKRLVSGHARLDACLSRRRNGAPHGELRDRRTIVRRLGWNELSRSAQSTQQLMLLLAGGTSRAGFSEKKPTG